MRKHRSLSYRPALDGIRALAVLSVLLYHGAVGWAFGGFLGVDVFFVLSGYLITTLLLTEWNRWGSIDVVGFYVRRAKRLLPAVVLVSIAIAIWAATGAAADRLGAIRADGIASLLYVANWRFLIAGQSYFDQYGDPSPFRHMWSLAIEEQYYLFFPLLLILLLRWFEGRRRSVGLVLGALAAGSVLLMARLYTPGTDPSRVYYGTDTRIHELLIGSILALILVKRRALAPSRVRAVGFATVVPVAALLWALHSASDQGAFLYRGGFALVCVAAALVVAGVELAPRGPVARVLGLRPVVWIGVISYGLYVWHWPAYIVLSPARTGLDGTGLLAVRLVVTFAVATASYYLVERPIRSGRLVERMRRPFGVVLASAALPVALVAVVAGTAGAVAPQLPETGFGVNGAQGHGKNDVLVVGDSVALTLSLHFPTVDFPSWKVTSSVKLGCGITAGQVAIGGRKAPPNSTCDGTIGTWRHAAATQKPRAVLMSIGSWEVMDQVVDGKILTTGSKAYARYLMGRLNEAHDALTATGAHLFLLNVPCYQATDSGITPTGASNARNDPTRRQQVNDVFARFVAQHPDDTTLLDLDSHICPNGKYTNVMRNQQIRDDGVHFTPAGSLQQWSWIMPQVEKLAGDKRTHVLVVGDSVPYSLTENFTVADHPDMLLQDLTKLGCGLIPVATVVEGKAGVADPDCATYSDQIASQVTRLQPDVGLVFAGIGEQFDRPVDGKVLKLGTPAHAKWLAGWLDRRTAPFLLQKAPVALVNVPCHQVPDPGTGGTPPVINDKSRIATLNKELAAYAADRDLPLLDLHGYLCDKGYFNKLPDGSKLRSDGLHFTRAGASYVWTWLEPKAQRLAKEGVTLAGDLPTAVPSGTPSGTPSGSPTAHQSASAAGG